MTGSGRSVQLPGALGGDDRLEGDAPVVPSARVDLDEIEADFADPGVVGLRNLGTVGTGPLCRLVAAVPGLVAEVRRLRRELECAQTALTEAFAEADEERDSLRAERDAARAEAERLREQVGKAIQAVVDDLTAALRTERREAARVREALQAIRELCDEWANTGNNPDDLWLDKGRADFQDRVRRLLPEGGA